MDFLYSFVATVVAYLIGSLSFAVIVSRLMGLNDPRTYGSKNPGATNVLRSGSKVAAVVTLLLELGAPLVLLHRRFVVPWVAGVWLMHASIAATMAVVFPYPLVLVAFAPFFRLERSRGLTDHAQ